ncbi:MAG: hypothetical protein ACFFBD_19600, partial [Candidatus Hodarchaeota archaeon]
KIMGSLTCLENLTTTTGSIKLNGSLGVKKNLISMKDIEVGKTCVVGGKIQADKVKVYGTLEAASIIVKSVILDNSVTVEGDIKASESITLGLQSRYRKIDVKGWIEAPLVILKPSGFYTKLSRIPNAVRRAIGMKAYFKKDIHLENLRIRANMLRLGSYKPVDQVNYLFSKDCMIEVDKTELIQIDPIAPPLPNIAEYLDITDYLDDSDEK